MFHRFFAVQFIGVCSLCLMAGCSWMGDYSPLASVERSLIFQPAMHPNGDWEPRQLEFENVEFEAADGTKLHGWFVPHEHPRAVVLFAHGNAGNLTHRIRILQELRYYHQVSVMIFDYRGYGKSEGSPSEAGILADARAARKWLAHREGISEDDIVLMGRSLGGGVMVDLAAKNGARGLILENTFTSLPDVAQNLMPLFPASLLMTYRLDSMSKIEQYKGPLLQSHGDKDQLIPIQLAKDLFKKANGDKHFVVIPNGGHNSGRTEKYRKAIDEFLATLPPVHHGLQWGQRFSPGVERRPPPSR